jgi:guanine deaminase
MARLLEGVGRHDHGRRELISRVARFAGAVAALALLPIERVEAAQPGAATVQPPSADKEEFMKRAFEMRRLAQQNGDQGFGAVLVKDGRIVGEGPSRVVTNRDPTAHAEMEAIRDAARRLGTRDLSGCEIFASSRPCPMCETACHWANISKVYYGESIADGGPPRYRSC